MIKEGTSVKDFMLPDQAGELLKFSSLKSSYRIIYFYPKDNTPGCTKEACGFRDEINQIKDLEAVVIGISADTPQAHGKFALKFNLPFILLSDPEHKVIDAFGAWGKKIMYGKGYEGITRSTFIIDEKGRVIKAFTKVKPEAHALEVIDFLKSLHV